jgi:hypothetical protein
MEKFKPIYIHQVLNSAISDVVEDEVSGSFPSWTRLRPICQVILNNLWKNLKQSR